MGHGDVSGLGGDGQAGRERGEERGEWVRGELLLCFAHCEMIFCCMAYLDEDVPLTYWLLKGLYLTPLLVTSSQSVFLWWAKS